MAAKPINSAAHTQATNDFMVVSIPQPAAISQWVPVPFHRVPSAKSEQLRYAARLTLGIEFQSVMQFREMDVLERQFHPEWGYLAPRRNFIRTLRAALIAAALGAVAGGGIVLWTVGGAPEDSHSVAARTPLPAEVEVTTKPSGVTYSKLLSTEPQRELPLPAPAQSNTKTTETKGDGESAKPEIQFECKSPGVAGQYWFSGQSRDANESWDTGHRGNKESGG
jgi:hypothetical protein